MAAKIKRQFSMQGMQNASDVPRINERIVSAYGQLEVSDPGQNKYVTLYRALLETILNVGPGFLLPTATELAASIDVSRWTAGIAYGRLSAEGYVSLVKRWGVFVNDREKWPIRRVSPTGQKN
jgi:DNA-binding GntR family transcriptional regulator